MAIEAVRHVVKTARVARGIARSKAGGLPTRELSRAYVKVRMKELMASRYKKPALSPETLLGLKVAYINYKSFAFLFDEIFIKQEYHFRASRRDPLIIDCGSNIGMAVLYFKLLHPDASIIAFEPSKEAFDLLRRNVEANRLQNVSLHNSAVYDEAGPLDFYYDPQQANLNSLTMSAVSERSSRECDSVQAVRLSDHIHEPVDMLKMDIEGAELRVIRELAGRNKLRLVREMILEYHHHINGKEDRLSELLKILEDQGFGYQIRGGWERFLEKEQFQDLLIYAYHKNPEA